MLPPPVICDLGSSCFVDALAQPLSRVTALREAVTAESATGLGRFTELSELFRMMNTHDMVEWDGYAFDDLFTPRDAHDCFEIFHEMFKDVSHEDVLGAFSFRSTIGVNRRSKSKISEQTFVVAVPDPPAGSEVAVPGVQLEDLLVAEVEPLRGGPRQFVRTVESLPPVFVIELNRVDIPDEEAVGEFVERPTQVLFPPVLPLEEIFRVDGSGIYVLSGVVVHGESDGETGHFWSYVREGARWWELDGSSRDEVAFEDVVAPQVLKTVVGLFYVAEPVDQYWSPVGRAVELGDY